VKTAELTFITVVYVH